MYIGESEECGCMGLFSCPSCEKKSIKKLISKIQSKGPKKQGEKS